MKKKNIILIVVVAVLLIGSVIAALLLGNKGDSEENSNGGVDLQVYNNQDSKNDGDVQSSSVDENLNTADNGEENTVTATPNLEDVYEALESTAYEWDDSANVTNILLNQDKVTVEGNGVKISGKDIIIQSKGQYDVSGVLQDGRIIVDAKDCQVMIRLNGADITCSYSSAIYSYKSDNTILLLAEGTTNSLTDTDSYIYEDEYSNEVELEPNACLYSKTDLNICGSGNLTINGKMEQGITGKDTLRIFNSDIQVSSVGKAILGKDALIIKSSNIVADAGDDGLHSNGNVVIEGGSHNIASGDDGIHGDLVVACFNTVVDVTKSNEGVEGYYVLCENSVMDMTSSDDGFNATDGSGSEDMFGGGGMPGGMPGGMNFGGDGAMELPDGGNMELPEKPDGSMGFPGGENMELPEGDVMELPDGSTMERPEKPNGGTMEFPGSGNGDMTTGEDGTLGVGIEFVDCSIKVNAEGDGIDSNGSLTFNGGEYIIYGSSNGGNAGLDYATSCEYISGTLIVVDVAGMCLVPNVCSQTGLDVTMDSYIASGDIISVVCGSEKTEVEAVKTANHITVIADNMKEGDIYTILVNDDSIASVTLEENITYYGNSGMGGFGRGQR